MKRAPAVEARQMTMFTDFEVVAEAKAAPKAPPATTAISRLAALQGIEWSYSRRGMLDQCVRRYYNKYFGANKRAAKGESNKEKLHFLKGLQSRYERTGKILHLAIATYFRRMQAGEEWELERLQGFAQRIFRGDCEYSRNYHAETAIIRDEKYPPALLREYYYKQPDADALCAEAEERMLAGIVAFATSDVYSVARTGGARPGMYVEQRFTLPKFPCKVTGAIDLAYWDGETLVIVDWKLNESSGSGDDSLQLATYALWAVQSLGCAPEQVCIYKAHLPSGDLVPFRIDAGLLAAARARIIQDAERMADLQEFARSATKEAFSPCLQERVCANCPFQEDCYD